MRVHVCVGYVRECESACARRRPDRQALPDTLKRTPPTPPTDTRSVRVDFRRVECGAGEVLQCGVRTLSAGVL